MKRTLITKLSTDITDFNEEQIKAYSDFLRASFASGGFSDISFEITQENREDMLAKWLRSIRDEFQANDAPAEKSDDKPRD